MGLMRVVLLSAVLVAACSTDGTDDEGDGSSAGAGAGAGTGAGAGATAGSGTGSAGTGSAAGSGADGDAGTGQSGAACGSRGLGPCDDGELCSFPEGASCGEADAPGTCEPIPTGCTKELAPVCGCDGMTYPNRCNALAAGVSVRDSGECGGGGSAGSGGGEPSGDTCGGFAGLGCPDGEYCDYAQGQGCGVADGTGVCEVQPSACTFESNPVCGCDGETYGNPCGAAAAGVSIDHMGEC